jgi:glutamate dehydrogenase
VVTSSCEVAGSMLLSKEEFVSNKQAIVDDVLVKLRNLARYEGELLFREYSNYPGALPHFSERISAAIAKVTDAITDALDNVQPEDALFKELFPLIKEGLPAEMVEIGGDRIAKAFPVQYQRNAIACALASKLVYKEGIHLVEIQPHDMVADRAFQYYRQDQKIRKLIEELSTPAAALNKDNKAVILDILHRGGARASLNIF